MLAWFIALIAAVIVGFLMLAQYSRKETAIGYLTPTTGTAKIFAPQAGTIKQVFVEEGEPVKEGQPLLAVETNQIAADGIDVNANMFDLLRSQQRADAERERLTALVRSLRLPSSTGRSHSERTSDGRSKRADSRRSATV